MPPIIKLENVNFYYEKGKPTEVHALKDINLEIQAGEYVSFFGPSGCGKSTLLYIIAGVERPTEGKVIINGQNLADFSLKEIAVFRQIGIGIIFQNFNLIPSLKVIENVTLPMTFLGINPTKRRQRGLEILERLNIGNLAERYPYELSGGQQQRVGIARALANNPPIILADEPIGNLDSANAENVLDILKEFHEKDKKTIIIVTHEAWSLRDVGRIFYVKDGAIIKEDTQKPKDVKERALSPHYENLFPELPTLDVKAKMMAALFLRGYPKEQMERFEYFLRQLLGDKIDKELFRMLLDRPYQKGGVGLWKQKAAKIADQVENIIQEEKALEEIYKKLEKHPEDALYSEIEKISAWLLQDFRVQLSSFQKERFYEAVGERIRNIITADNFRRVLSLGKDQGGVGLRITTSLKVAEKMEMLLGRDTFNLSQQS
jgi:putative ABC transport system ATP-binding protein